MISISFDNSNSNSVHEFTLCINHLKFGIYLGGSYIDDVLTLNKTKFIISELIDSINNDKYLTIKPIYFKFSWGLVNIDIESGGINTTYVLEADDFRKAFIDCLLEIQNITADSEFD